VWGYMVEVVILMLDAVGIDFDDAEAGGVVAEGHADGGGGDHFHGAVLGVEV